MKIYLVRHTVYDNPDALFAFDLPFNLSIPGRQKARKIGEWLKSKGTENYPIFTSPIVRVIQTAEIIASATDSFVTIDERLTEVKCPNLQGKPIPEKNPWIVEEDDPSRESHEKVKARTLSIFEEKIKEGRDCILVSHGEGLTILYYHLQNKDLPEYIWSPENESNVVQRGEVIEVEVQKGSIKSFHKFSDLQM